MRQLKEALIGKNNINNAIGVTNDLYIINSQEIARKGFKIVQSSDRHTFSIISKRDIIISVRSKKITGRELETAFMYKPLFDVKSIDSLSKVIENIEYENANEWFNLFEAVDRFEVLE